MNKNEIIDLRFGRSEFKVNGYFVVFTAGMTKQFGRVVKIEFKIKNTASRFRLVAHALTVIEESDLILLHGGDSNIMEFVLDACEQSKGIVEYGGEQFEAFNVLERAIKEDPVNWERMLSKVQSSLLTNSPLRQHYH